MCTRIQTFLLFLGASALAALAASPIEKHGELSVSGNQVVDASGSPTQLSGPSLYWSLWTGEKFYNKDVVDWVVKDWKANVIRAAMGVEKGGYLTDPETQYNYVTTIIDAAIADSIYVIVDYHAHDANLSVEQAEAFFDSLGRKYGDIPNIIWEIWNEPDMTNGSATDGTDTWVDDIKPYAEKVIPVIRKYSDNIIVVGTPYWSGQPLLAASSPLTGNNIAYALHFYAATHKQTVRTAADNALKKGLAIMITEFGMCSADGGKETATIDSAETEKWLDWADSNKISWLNWSLSSIQEAASALNSTASTTGNWSDDDLTVSGKWIRARMILTNDSGAVTSIASQNRLGSAWNVQNGMLFLPKASFAKLGLMDASGRELWSWSGWLGAGPHNVQSMLPASFSRHSNLIASVKVQNETKNWILK